jgi:endonuclease YncB( thermonuclease family)
MDLSFNHSRIREKQITRTRSSGLARFDHPLILLLVLALSTLIVSSVNADDLVGNPRIVDGDTIWIGGTKIRLHGIDAPEMKQECHREDGTGYRCGEASTDALRVLVGVGSIRCEGDTYDRYKRLIATCYSGTVNLNAELVRQGWALAYRRYSEDYIAAEKKAQEAKHGMWAGKFKLPWEWRRKLRGYGQ